MFAGVSAIMFGCMLYCINCMREVYINYNFYNNWSDFNMVSKTVYEYTETSQGLEIKHSGEREYLGAGIEKADINQISDISGVKAVDYAIKDRFHYYKWDGMENSTNYKALIEAYSAKHPLECYMEGLYLTEFDELKKEVNDRGDSQKINWELIEKGEQAVLFVNLYYDEVLFENYTTSVVSEENTIKAGDNIRICHAITEAETEVSVGAVYFFNKPSFKSEFSTNSYMLVGSSALAEKIANNEGVELKYNYINIDYNSLSSYQATDKQLALFAYERGMEYGSSAEYLRARSMERIQKTAIYGSLFVVMAVAYIAIYANIFESKKVYLEKQIGTFKQIGMSDSQYVRMFYFNECKILLWGLVGIILFYLFIGYGRYVEYEKFAANNTMGYSSIINAFTDNPVILTAGALIDGMQHGLYIISAVIMYLLMIAGSYIAVRRSINKEER